MENFSKELLADLLDEAKDKNTDVPQYIHNELIAINRIRSTKKRLREELQILKKDFDAAVGRNKDSVTELQKECKHRQRTYYGDPAGGNDSFHECNDCGKQE
jgi:hypothetical protein